ncbi:MAG: malonyl-CoA/methylmalonyl-CoA synthetase [Verrucomicrobiales bacterium]
MGSTAKAAMNGNLFDLLRTHWSVAPDRHFLVPDVGDAITYRSMDERSARFARVLQQRGVTPGERVVVQVTKSVDNVALYLACLRTGATYVPLNTSYTDNEVAFFVEDAAPKLVVRDDRGQTPEVQSDEEGLTPVVRLDDLAREADSVEPWFGCETRLADDLAVMIYTSGTTGRSKGAMLTHANLTSNALTLHSIWRFTPGDVLLHVLPIYHVHGLFVALHTAILNASTVLFCERYDVDKTLALLPQATVMMGVPTHYIRLLDHQDFDRAACANMRLFTSGSAPMTEPVHAAFTERTGHQILERYGMSEAGMITSNPYEGERIAGTVGYPLPGVRIRVVADDGIECEPESVGVVQAQGPNIFAGYWRLPEKTEESYHDDWFVTGDVGSVDGEGRLTLEGRSGDMIISGGLNIYPREIELVLDGCQGVGESAVVGHPDPDFGECVVAYVVGDGTRELDASELRTVLATSLASFKLPKSFVFIDELPRNSMGKVQKSTLRSVDKLDKLDMG